MWSFYILMGSSGSDPLACKMLLLASFLFAIKKKKPYTPNPLGRGWGGTVNTAGSGCQTLLIDLVSLAPFPNEDPLNMALEASTRDASLVVQGHCRAQS